MSLSEQTMQREVLPELSHLSVTHQRSSLLGKEVTVVPTPRAIQLSVTQGPYSALANPDLLNHADPFPRPFPRGALVI